jgi:hypothetical protein
MDVQVIDGGVIARRVCTSALAHVTLPHLANGSVELVSSRGRLVMSAVTPKADMSERRRNVR